MNEGRTLSCDVLIAGGGVGGCAAAMRAASLGARVLLTEETPWIGGQFTSQGVPPDEHPWIERFGCTAQYRRFRQAVREHYRRQRRLKPAFRDDLELNPGRGWVSRLCHEPKVALSVLEGMLRPFVGGSLEIRRRCRPVAAHALDDRVLAVDFLDLESGDPFCVEARFVLDATETGELLPMAGAEYVLGAESQRETGEPHAVSGDPEPENVQGFTWCLAMAFDPAVEEPMDKPSAYELWRSVRPQFWPGPLLGWQVQDPVSGAPRRWTLFASEGTAGLFEYRRIVSREVLEGEVCEVSCVNWPQNDYFFGSILDVPDHVRDVRLRESRELTLSLLYWLKHEAPRPDGGCGYRGLRASPEVSGTPDGLMMAPYVRESRRIRAEFTVLEQHVASECNPGRMIAGPFPDSVGIGAYRIDLHPSANGRGYVDIGALPFQIPLGSMIPVRIENLIPACKNIGTTHVTNGCYRLHPVEWNVGEAAGALASFCVARNVVPRQVRRSPELLAEFQNLLTGQGFELAWPNGGPL